MEQYSNNTALTRIPQDSPAWMGQPPVAGNPQGAPMWMGQPPAAGNPQGAPMWMGQPPAAGNPQGTSAWMGLSAAMPFGILPTQLDRSSPWPALRLIARWLKIIAWVELVLGIIVTLIGSGSLITLSPLLGFVMLIFLLFETAIGFILTYAAAELILVFLAIEKNTRKNE